MESISEDSTFFQSIDNQHNGHYFKIRVKIVRFFNQSTTKGGLIRNRVRVKIVRFFNQSTTEMIWS